MAYGGTEGKRMTVIGTGSRKTLEGGEAAEVAVLVGQYRAAKATQRNAEEAAKAAHERLAAILGDAEVAVDADGLPVVRMPWRERRTIGVDEALTLAPILAGIVRTTRYRVVAN